MSKPALLPPGQRALDHFPRFGLSQYANRVPDVPDRWTVDIGGDVGPITIDAQTLAGIARTEQLADFHCVTTWSRLGLHWGGWRFRDVCDTVLDDRDHALVAIRGRDGYDTGLRYEDVLADDALLADTLDGEPLSVAHGAPLRLVAPAHYGYKNVKHITRIDFWRDPSRFRRRGLSRIIDHPRARVAHEERGNYLPGAVYRYLYRPFVNPTIKQFQRGLERKR